MSPGTETHVGIELLDALDVALEGARILLEIFSLAKLCRIHKHRYDHAFGVLARKFDETQVPCVEVAHGRNERDVFFVMAPAFEQFAHLFPGTYYFHKWRSCIRKSSAWPPDSFDP